MTSFPPLRRVLAAVDFHEASAAAAALAGVVAQGLGAHLTVLHAEVLDMPPYFTPAQLASLEAERQQARAAAAEYVRAFAARHTPAEVETRVVDGPAVEAVLEAGRAFDLIVLGTHGRRGPLRWWLGSVAEGVVRRATVPVLVTCALDDDRLARARARAAALPPELARTHWTDVLGHILETAVHTGEPADVLDALRTCDAPLLYVPDTLQNPERSRP